MLVCVFKPTPVLVQALRDDMRRLAASDLPALLDQQLALRKPDVTPVLIATAEVAARDNVALSRPVLAATCRAACQRLGKEYPGATIEVRVPPFAAVQVGFGSGPSHTRGTPPNVVEMAPDEFVRLITGQVAWADARMSVSGTHAHEVAAVFPLT